MRTVDDVSSPRPCDRCVNPDAFGRDTITLVEARTLDEQIANAVAARQHDAAHAVQRRLAELGRDVAALSRTLEVGPDQLRRKLTGRATASVADLVSWDIALSALAAVQQPVRAPRVSRERKLTLPSSPEHIDSWTGAIWQGDCLALMRHMPAQSINLVLADLPYGTTRNRWDSAIDLDELWARYRHVLAPGGCVVLTAAQPFTSTLVTSNLAWFRYEWIWSKTIGSGQLNIAHQPLRTHESILVFAPGRPPYHPQMTSGTPYTITRRADEWNGRGFNAQSAHTSRNTGQRWPKSVLPVANPRIKGGHPTQKPVALFEYLIRTYTVEGQIVLDNVMGSGTTAEAARNTGRRWVGMEIDAQYVRQARRRLR